MIVLKCKDTIKETYGCKTLKIDLREELLSKASAYQPFQTETHFIKRCLTSAAAPVKDQGKERLREGEGDEMQTNTSPWLPGGFYFP